MKLLATTTLSFSLFASASAQTNPSTTPIRTSQTITIARSGSQPATRGPASNFTGSVRVDPLFQAKAPSTMTSSTVTFEPGAHSAWHTHPLGQTLIVTQGIGRVQGWGSPVKEMRHGDVVRIPAHLKHWHGAAPTTAMAHIAIVEQLNGKSTTWLEKVSAAQYAAPVEVAPIASVIEVRPAAQIKPASPGAKNMSQEPANELTPAQKAIGGYSPKMVELTDNVLFGDIWERPGLSKRDRSMVTVTALITGGNTEQLPNHLALAKKNGVTEDEIVEVITHLAFYTGWPKAMSAIQIAKKVFGN